MFPRPTVRRPQNSGGALGHRECQFAAHDQGAFFASAIFLFALAAFHAALHKERAFQASSPINFQGRSLGIGPFFAYRASRRHE